MFQKLIYSYAYARNIWYVKIPHVMLFVFGSQAEQI